MPRSRLFHVTDATMVGACRRETAALAQQLGFNPTDAGNAAIIATELAANLHKHARQGLFLLRKLPLFDPPGLEILSLDKGPGIPNLDHALADGFSTAGSPGTGLGAVARLASCFDLYTQPGQGTALVVQLYPRQRPRPQPYLLLGVVCAPYPGESLCGDDWALSQLPQRFQLLLVDGLGHGPQAALAADAAVAAFSAANGDSPAVLLKNLHGPLRPTRGAAVALADVDPAASLLRYAGVGNISGVVINRDGATRSLISHNGTLGHELHRVAEFSYPWPPGATLIMHSDGLLSRWNLASYPGLLARHPALIAAVLYRDFQRPRDDVTVVVARSKSLA